MERTNDLQTLVRTRQGFVVFDPRVVAGTCYSIDDRGTLVSDRVPAGATLAVVAGTGVVAAALLGSGWWRLAWLLAGLAAGVVLAALLLGLLYLVDSPERRYRRLTGSTVFSAEVTSTADPLTWQLCVLGRRTADTSAWRSGMLDPDRLLGPLLWAAVGGLGGGFAADAQRMVARDRLAVVAEIAVELDRAGVRLPCGTPVEPATDVGTAVADHADKLLDQARAVRALCD